MQIFSAIVGIVAVIALSAWFSQLQQRHRCLNVCGWQRMWSVTFRESLSQDVEPVAAIQMLENNNTRLYSGDLKVPDGEATSLLTSAQPYLAKATNTANTTAERIDAINNFRDISHRLCSVVQSEGLYIIRQGQVASLCSIMVTLLTLWYLAFNTRETYSRAQDTSLRSVVSVGSGCLVDKKNLKIVVASGRFTVELGATFASDIEGTRIADYIQPLDDFQGAPQLFNITCRQQPINLLRADGTTSQENIGITSLACGYIFVWIELPPDNTAEL